MLESLCASRVGVAGVLEAWCGWGVYGANLGEDVNQEVQCF